MKEILVDKNGYNQFIEELEKLKQQSLLISSVGSEAYQDAIGYANGDERYKSNKFWRNLINISGGIILEEKSMHYMSRMKRILNYKKYFRPYPYRIFVIKSKNNI